MVTHIVDVDVSHIPGWHIGDGDSVRSRRQVILAEKGLLEKLFVDSHWRIIQIEGPDLTVVELHTELDLVRRDNVRENIEAYENGP